ncbi:MAG: LD-carboxypeptidase [Bdellovibrionales bacterium]|nr:LD-carboxypeptidase [Bdellovibrionales bacterium]
MKMWSPLAPGDLIDVISPASPCSREEILASQEFLREQGFQFRFPKSPKKHPYFAGSDEARAKDLVRALIDPKSQAVWCLRGGYGAARILDAVVKLPRPRQTKLFIGLSDITALHVFLNQKWGWSTLHAPVLARMGMRRGSEKETKELMSVLRGTQNQIVHRLVPMNAKAKAHKTSAKGVVRGGNLTVLQSLVGTKVHPHFKGCFVFLEDVGERGYRLDRTLHHLVAAGVFDGIKGIILGDFIGGDEPSGKNFVKLSLKEFAAEATLPIWSGIKSGHGALQRPVAFETPSLLKNEDGRFSLIQPTGVIQP